jgi:hypothetical protein
MREGKVISKGNPTEVLKAFSAEEKKEMA